VDGDPLTLGERLLTAYEVARELHLSRSQVYKLMERGDLPGLKVGRARRFRREDLQDYMARHLGPIRRRPSKPAPHKTPRNPKLNGSP